MRFKFRFVILMFALAFMLSGCSETMIKKGQDRFYDMTILVSNYDRIKVDHVNLKLEVVNGDPQGLFDWDVVGKNVKDGLENKGIKVSDEGIPVTLRLNDFVSINRPRPGSGVGTGISGGTVLGLGGSIAQGVTASLAESAITNSIQKEKSEEMIAKGPVLCDTSSCSTSTSFTILSAGYESNISITGSIGLSNPIWTAETYNAKAIVEMFEPAK